MADLILPHFAVGSGHEIIIDGVTYRVPLIDADGRVYTNAKATGAGEVQAAYYQTVDPSTTRATVVTPTTGKKIRLVGIQLGSIAAETSLFQVYFGTGASLPVSTGKEIAMPYLDNTQRGAYVLSWPDGAGPVGAVNDVVSLLTNVNVTTGGLIIVHYREE